jgi:hypothetical protein
MKSQIAWVTVLLVVLGIVALIALFPLIAILGAIAWAIFNH